MRHFGGKDRSRKIVVQAMKPWLDVAPMYVEPFVGGLSIARTVRERYPHLPMVLSDLGTVAPLYRACLTIYESEGVDGLAGYLPKVATEEAFLAVRPEDPLWAFYRIGCAFGGKEKSGFAREGERDFCQSARNSLLRDIPLLASGPLAICHGSYESLPYESLPPRTVVYCDPPYEARTGYHTNRSRPFDHDAFVTWLRSRRDLAIFVSEGPRSRLSDVWPYVSWERSKKGMRGKNEREERLFYPPWLGVP